MKIVHVVQSLQTGGAESLLVNLAIYSNAKFDVTVISQYPKSNLPLEKLLEGNGIKTIYLNKKKGLDLGNIAALYKTLGDIRPDIIHTHLHAAVYAVPWYICRKNIVKIHTVHSIAEMEFGTIHKAVQSFAFKALGVVPVAISPTVKESIIKQYKVSKDDVPVILNGVNVSRFSAQCKKDNSLPFTIINVASFNKWKNQALLLNAFYKAVLKQPNMSLIFVGDGVEKKTVERTAKSLGIVDKVQFAGVTDEVEKYLCKADVFALSSNFEGLSLAILEAYSAGLPVIATNVGGVPDILEDGINGVLVPPNNDTALQNAILSLYANPGLRLKMSANNRLKARDFDMSGVAEKYIELYLRHGEKNGYI